MKRLNLLVAMASMCWLGALLSANDLGEGLPRGRADWAAYSGEENDFFADGGRIKDGRKNYWLALELRVFSSELSGFFEFEDTGTASPTTPVVGDHVDFVKDLGIKPHRTLLIPEISFNFWGTQTIRVGYYSLVDSARNRITRSFIFGGNTYTFNDDINSDFDLRMLKVRYEWGLFSFEYFNMAMGFGGDVIWIHAHVDDTTSGTTLDTGHRVGGVPILELRMRANFGYGVGIEVQAEGFHLGLGWIGRGSAGLDWQVLRFLSIQGGFMIDSVGVNMRELNGIRAGARQTGGFGAITFWF